MTVVLEDQVKTITAEIAEQFGDGSGEREGFDYNTMIEDVVRAVIAQYDISTIARLGTFDDGLRLEWPVADAGKYLDQSPKADVLNPGRAPGSG
jgi:deoxyribodipyrimidine photolyase-like uncharacterized protein